MPIVTNPTGVEELWIDDVHRIALDTIYDFVGDRLATDGKVAAMINGTPYTTTGAAASGNIRTTPGRLLRISWTNDSNAGTLVLYDSADTSVPVYSIEMGASETAEKTFSDTPLVFATRIHWAKVGTGNIDQMAAVTADPAV